MADIMKPHVAERVAIIRQWETDMNLSEAKDIGFNKYHNYYAPKGIVSNSSTVLSFGVGGECKFEKLILNENKNLDLYMFDPTPRTKRLIEGILFNSAKRDINNKILNEELAKKIKFFPYAYNHTSGKNQFYYDPYKEGKKKNGSTESLLQSFSLKKQNDKFESVLVDTMNITDIMKKFNLHSVDIIKADIEGLWQEISDEIIDNKINIKMLATEFELIFYDIDTALAKAKVVVDKFKSNGYKAFINRRREKLMLEMLFVREDLYEG